MDTVTTLRSVVVPRLRTVWNVTVVEIPGWETRGKGPMPTIRGHVQHHVGGPRLGDAVSLRTVTFGRAGLRNSLSMWFTARTSGVVYLVAAGVSWHAGASLWGGYSSLNGRFAGNEAEHSGSAFEPWSEASLHAQAAVAYEMRRAFDHPLGNIADHKEVAVPRGRKPDRVNIDGGQWRRRIAAMQPPSQQEDDVPRFIKRDPGSPDVYAVYADHVRKVPNSVVLNYLADGPLTIDVNPPREVLALPVLGEGGTHPHPFVPTSVFDTHRHDEGVTGPPR